MMMPTECFLVVDKDRHGRPRGLEKANGKIYLTYFDAAQDCGTGQCVVECVIKERGPIVDLIYGKAEEFFSRMDGSEND